MAAPEEDRPREGRLTGNETIVAPSSATGPAPRAVVRASGAKAFALAAAIGATVPDTPAGRGASQARLVLDGHGTICPADVWWFAGPGSYTGEDVVELHVPGAPKLVDMLVARLVAEGARIATPGEFTRRALEGGRIDVTRAEAVAALIRARDEAEWGRARALLDGGLARAAATVVDRLVTVLAPIELGLDFSDQDVSFSAPDDVRAAIVVLARDVRDLAVAAPSSARRSLPRVVLRGPANAGKSSLFNALLRADVAITAPVRGTTRDVLCARWRHGDVEAFLVDTAGDDVRGSAFDALAGLARERALLEADLVVEVRDARAQQWPAPRPDRVRVATMIDLARDAALDDDVAGVSNVTGEGIDACADRIARSLRAAPGAHAAPFLVTARHAGHLGRAADALERAHAALPAHPPELLASDLREALRELRALSGAAGGDPVLDRIFKEFCIGK